MAKDRGATWRVLKGEEQDLRTTPSQAVFPIQRQLFAPDTGGLRVSGTVKMRMRKLQKKLNIQSKKQIPEKSGLATVVFPTQLVVRSPAPGAICAQRQEAVVSLQGLGLEGHCTLVVH